MSCLAPEQRGDLAKVTVHREVQTQRQSISSKAGDLGLRGEQKLYQEPLYFRLRVKNLKEISTVSTEQGSAVHRKITLYVVPREVKASKISVLLPSSLREQAIPSRIWLQKHTYLHYTLLPDTNPLFNSLPSPLTRQESFPPLTLPT